MTVEVCGELESTIRTPTLLYSAVRFVLFRVLYSEKYIDIESNLKLEKTRLKLVFFGIYHIKELNFEMY